MNFAAWGANRERIAQTLRQRYGWQEEAVRFFTQFATTPSDVSSQALAVIEAGLARGVETHRIIRAARMLQEYELMFGIRSWRRVHTRPRKGCSMQWRPWWCAVALAVVLLGCSNDDTPNDLTGTWTGTIQDSQAGRGMLLLSLSHINTQLTGSWQQTFPDAQHNTGGTLSGTASARVSGDPRDVLITMVWSPTQAGACMFTVEAMLDNNDLDHFTGTYVPMNCPQPTSGSLDVNRR